MELVCLFSYYVLLNFEYKAHEGLINYPSSVRFSQKKFGSSCCLTKNNPNDIFHITTCLLLEKNDHLKD